MDMYPNNRKITILKLSINLIYKPNLWIIIMTRDYDSNLDDKYQGKDLLKEETNLMGVKLTIFNNIEEFVRDQNNYYMHFRQSAFGDIRRQYEYYQSFKDNYPDLEQRLRIKIGKMEKLHELEEGQIASDLCLAYNLMVKDINENPFLLSRLLERYNRINIDTHILTR